MSNQKSKHLSNVTRDDVDQIYTRYARELHEKIDATRDAYLGFIFPVTRADLMAVSDVFGLPADAARQIALKSREFSSFRAPGRGSGQLTNHIYGASLLALRGKSLDSGLAEVADDNLANLVAAEESTILEIAEARAGWFGRIYFPAQAFANAIAVFGGKVSPERVYEQAQKYGFAAEAGSRKTVRGDFGIGLWLTLLARAP